MSPAPTLPPCVLHEDEHLLVVNKPSGWNTHAPAAYAGDGIYDWLRHREPRWATLAIVHRLDKDTSGVMLFAKTALANRELSRQFARHEIRKRYLLRSDRGVPGGRMRVASAIERAGDRYVAQPKGAGGDEAVTDFTPVPAVPGDPSQVVVAEPLTGRTHQIRVHAAAQGFPVLGDTLYGGGPAARLCLHAASITIRHPATGAETTFEAPPEFDADPRAALRAAFIDRRETDAWRLLHGAADGEPGWYLDRLGEYLLSQSEDDLPAARRALLPGYGARGVYHKRLSRQVHRLAAADASPAHLHGESAPERFVVRENGVRYELGLGEGYSTGLFLDQRDNRRRLLVNHVAAGFTPFPGGANGRSVLNAFAYTCGFSVCAALAGATVTSLDLSKKYLERGRRNFVLNGLDPAAHDFIYGDALDWLRRLARKGRRFDAVILDPPTFSKSREHGTFSAERDYERLVVAALAVLAPGGVLLASTNAARIGPAGFCAMLRAAAQGGGRTIEAEHYAAQPPDFPITREEPAYFKSVWMRVG